MYDRRRTLLFVPLAIVSVSELMPRTISFFYSHVHNQKVEFRYQ